MTSDGLNIAELRAETPGCQHRNRLNNAGAALLSTPTLAAMTHQLQLEAQIGGYEAAEAAAEALKAQGIHVSTTVAGHNQFDTRNIHPLVRLSPHYYNTEDEIDRAIEAVAALAR